MKQYRKAIVTRLLSGREYSRRTVRDNFRQVSEQNCPFIWEFEQTPPLAATVCFNLKLRKQILVFYLSIYVLYYYVERINIVLQ